MASVYQACCPASACIADTTCMSLILPFCFNILERFLAERVTCNFGKESKGMDIKIMIHYLTGVLHV